MILCFGTFARTLKYCKPDSGGVTDKELVGTMTQILDPDCGYMYDESGTVSKLLACTQNLSVGDFRATDGEGRGVPKSNVVQEALKIDTDEKVEAVVKEFKNKVIRLIGEDKKKNAALALLNIIENDYSLNSNKEQSFEKYLGTTKEAFLLQTEYNLPALFARIFLYTVTSVKNTEGWQCAKDITRDYIDSFSDPDYYWETKSQTLKKITFAMREIFERIIAEYKVPEYMMCDEPDHSSRIIELIKHIRFDILDKFTNHKEDAIYKDIQAFGKSLEAYNNTSLFIQASTLEYYDRIPTTLYYYDNKFTVIEKDREDLIKDKANSIHKLEQLKLEIDSHNKQLEMYPISDSSHVFKNNEEHRAFVGLSKKLNEMEADLYQLELDISDMDSVINQMDFLLSFIRERDNIFSLYAKICDGEKLKPPEPI